ncbi:hypothetical protein LSG31_19540 [Fodinisporobacter ferrooxydans]|uniref:Uncharacterized protein n=1 Tax=Fodinisporobacter ferrooxydans TaxID=2901836 RepID=A0ABY4CJ35_9BACL|nr:hypothetical protein LSG31_19540 [Alicyclobacillaceae bacterium MYW30-H2]
MRFLRRIGIGVAAIVLAFFASGCGSQRSENSSTLEWNGVRATIRPLSKGVNRNVLWSPSGNRFCYFSPETQSFQIGTVKPFSIESVRLPNQRHIVALTDESAIVASNEDDRNWIYPLTKTGIGKPTAWRAATDPWQEWADTQQGPGGILVGGYSPKSLELELDNGEHIPLNGEDAILSMDRKYGAVVSSHRLRRPVHSSGDTMMPAEHQPFDPLKPIVVWNFSATGGPRKQTVLQLPKIDLPNLAGQRKEVPGGIGISFSPDDKHVFVSVNTGGNGSKLTGESFLFDASTGHLMSKIPYGNGMQWSADGTSIWVNADQPQGTGEDKLVTLDGRMVNTWKDVYGRPAWVLKNATFLMSNANRQLGFTGWDHSFHPFPNLQAFGYANDPVVPSPNGHSGLLFLYNNTPQIDYGAVLVEMIQ